VIQVKENLLKLKAEFEKESKDRKSEFESLERRLLADRLSEDSIFFFAKRLLRTKPINTPIAATAAIAKLIIRLYNKIRHLLRDGTLDRLHSQTPGLVQTILDRLFSYRSTVFQLPHRRVIRFSQGD